MNQIVFPLALALAATLATTGCKHTPVKVTPIYGNQPSMHYCIRTGSGGALIWLQMGWYLFSWQVPGTFWQPSSRAKNYLCRILPGQHYC